MKSGVILAISLVTLSLALFILTKDGDAGTQPRPYRKDGCWVIPGAKGKNGGGDGGAAVICGNNATAYGGRGGNANR